MKTRTRRAISLTVIVAILLSLAANTVLAKNSYTVGTTSESLVPAKEILFSENFNSLAVDSTVAKEQNLGSAGNQLYVYVADGDVKIKGNGTDNYVSVAMNSAGTKGQFGLRTTDATKFVEKYTTEFKFMLPDDNAVGDSGIFYNLGGVGTTPKSYFGARIKYYGGNKFQVFNGSASSYVADNKILQGVWYTMKVETDLANGKWSLYINGTSLVRNYTFHSKSVSDNMLTPFLAGAFTGEVCYDDIIIYRDPVGRTTYAAEDFSGYGSGIDWSTYENPGFVGANYMPSDYNSAAVDRWDTWLHGIQLAPAKLHTNGEIANGKLQLGGTGKQSIVLINEYSSNHSISEDMAVSFTFNTTNAANNHDEIYRMRENSAKTGGIRLQLNSRRFMADSPTGGALYEGMKDNRDYRITVVSDFSTKTYSVYLDGVCLATGLEHRKYEGTDPYNNNGRPFEVSLWTQAPTCYYDDLVIYADVREDVMAQAMGAAMTNAKVVKDGASSFALPASAIDGYTVEWSSDSSVISIANGTATVAYPDEEQTVTLTATVADTANEYAIARKFQVTVPSKYDTAVNAEDGVVTGTVTVNETAAEGYNGGKAILAIYDSEEKLINVNYINASNGAATVTSDEITEAGNYTAKLFFWDFSIGKPFTKIIEPFAFEVE